MKGQVVTLQTGATGLQRDTEVMWLFESGDQTTRIAQLFKGTVFTHYEPRLETKAGPRNWITDYLEHQHQ